MQPLFLPEAGTPFPNVFSVIDRAGSDLNVNIKLRQLLKLNQFFSFFKND